VIGDAGFSSQKLAGVMQWRSCASNPFVLVKIDHLAAEQTRMM
jgi:hypothetical protein